MIVILTLIRWFFLFKVLAATDFDELIQWLLPLGVLYVISFANL